VDDNARKKELLSRSQGFLLITCPNAVFLPGGSFGEKVRAWKKNFQFLASFSSTKKPDDYHEKVINSLLGTEGHKIK